jgi:IS30 family transposase
VGWGYRPFDAHQQATARRARHHHRRIDTSVELCALLVEFLAQRWSPQQISRHRQSQFPDEPGMRLCHESLYQAVYRPGSAFLRPTPLAPHRRSPLRTGRDHRRAHQRGERRRPRFQQPMLTIHDRPFAPEDRSEAGHWEGDLIVGKDQGSAIGTLVERQTRMVRLLHLPRRDGASLHEALKTRVGDLPRQPVRPITWDQGTGMARHIEITESLKSPIYFCDSHSPWQRGSNENTDRLLRDYFPKGIDLNAHTPAHLTAVEHELNARPRMVLENRTPAELLRYC